MEELRLREMELCCFDDRSGIEIQNKSLMLALAKLEASNVSSELVTMF